MRKVAMIYNPVSGSRRQDRMWRIEAASSIFQANGIEVMLVPTQAAGSAGLQARTVVAEGCDTVIACGGDGTLHEILQGVAGTEAVLGVLPLGTANVVACDLGIPREPQQAAHWLLQAQPRRVTAGKIEYADFSGQTVSRYFVAAAGVGADAHLAYELSAEFKRNHGMAAYYAKATHLWATQKFPRFEVEFEDMRSQQRRVEIVTELLAVRITNFGGILRRMAPSASLHRNDLELVLFKTSSRWDYLRFVAANLLGRMPRVQRIEHVPARLVVCRPIASESAKQRSRVIYAEADGESLGRLPVTVTVEPAAFSLLVGGTPSLP